MQQLAIKVDVDTDRGTRIGVPRLVELFKAAQIPATFLFSLGPDNTGRAIKRIFRPGFFKKVQRTSVVSVYGIRTLLNGTLLPSPHIGKRNRNIMRNLLNHPDLFELGIHCHDHIRWQDGLHHMSFQQVANEFKQARDIFNDIFTVHAKTAGAAGWQANAHSLACYDQANLLYGSDTRGDTPFFPSVNDTVYKTLQIPTTLPTLDELWGRPEFPLASLHDHYLDSLADDKLNVLTIHAELEGMRMHDWFHELLKRLKERKIDFVRLDEHAKQLLKDPASIPVCPMSLGEVDGRSGVLAVQDIR